MKVTVKDYLNVRVGKPSVNAPTYQYLAPGSILDIEDRFYPGDTFEGISSWARDEADNYYWSGGLKLPISEKSEALKSLINYNQRFIGLSQMLRDSKGYGVIVAMLDTGIFRSHPDLVGSIIKSEQDFTLSPNGSEDVNGHGTHLAGLIGGRSKSNLGIIGMAPECKIKNMKVLLDSGDSVGDYLNAALENLVNSTDHIDILNLSLSITTKAYFELIDNLNKVSGKFIVIAAAGENSRLLASNEPYCPAYSSNVISVGTIDSAFLKKYPNPIFHNRVDYILPSIELISSSIPKYNYYRRLYGSSMATALTSGLTALLLSSNSKKGAIGIKFVKDEFDKMAVPFDGNLNLSEINLIKPKYQ